jgi:hypothetical protein
LIRPRPQIFVLEWDPRPPLTAVRWARVYETGGTPPYPSFDVSPVAGHSTTVLSLGGGGGGTAGRVLRHKVLLMGGRVTPAAAPRDPLRALLLDPRTLEYELLAPANTPPYTRCGHTATLVDNEMVVVGGGHCRGATHRDLFVLDFDPKRRHSAARRGVLAERDCSWRQVRPAGTMPMLSGQASVAWPPSVSHGGAAEGGGGVLTFISEEVTLLVHATATSLRTWSADATARQVEVRGLGGPEPAWLAPQKRSLPCGAFQPDNDYMVEQAAVAAMKGRRSGVTRAAAT